MKITAIVQARMGSTRLPGKVLTDLGGETVLARVVRRLGRASRIDEVVVATTDTASDHEIGTECARLKVSCFYGSEHNVLDRFLRAAEQFRCDLIVRVTADCPLIDPEMVDEVVAACITRHVDLSCNDVPHTFPRGLDVEAFTIETLRRVQDMADQPYQREHVTPLVYERPDIFRSYSVKGDRDLSHLRWTVDTPDDLKLIRAIYAHFENRDDFGWREALELVDSRPELAKIYAHVEQKHVTEIANVS
jgi:spore coat polysaccharide biosynthesis protein SpsF (cytidylyltransferase family)